MVLMEELEQEEGFGVSIDAEGNAEIVKPVWHYTNPHVIMVLFMLPYE